MFDTYNLDIKMYFVHTVTSKSNRYCWYELILLIWYHWQGFTIIWIFEHHLYPGGEEFRSGECFVITIRIIWIRKYMIASIRISVSWHNLFHVEMKWYSIDIIVAAYRIVYQYIFRHNTILLQECHGSLGRSMVTCYMDILIDTGPMW